METDLFQTALPPLLDLVFYPITPRAAIGLILIVVLLFCSGLLSGSEVAYFSLTPSELDELRERDSKRNRMVLHHLKNPENLLANILISNNFVNIGIVILASFVTTSLMSFIGSPVLGFVIKVVVITFLILLFGEIIPKVYADRFSPRFALAMARPLIFLGKLFRPLIYILTRSSNIVNKRLAGKRQNISMEELSDALDLATGVVRDEKKMLEGIVKFRNLEVSEIMKPRMDVTAVNINTPLDEVISIIIDSGYSRIPVFEETSDNVKGILYVKDLLPHLQKPGFKWQSLIRPPFFVPETKKINDLLQEFQKMKIHLAIVVDEYGGTEGIVTMEDILEEVVGEITDESDEAEEYYRKVDKNTYLFDGKTLLNDFFKITETEDEIFDDVRGEAETLAGLILELKGDFPRLGDELDCKNMRFKVTGMDKRRIREIKVTIQEVNNKENHES